VFDNFFLTGFWSGFPVTREMNRTVLVVCIGAALAMIVPKYPH